MIDVAPHELHRIGDLWDSLSRPLMFRAFTVGKSGFMGRACRRLALICDKHHTTIEELKANLAMALVDLQEKGLDRVNEVTGSRLDARLTFWRFIDPQDNLTALTDLAFGRTPGIKDQDKARHDQKAVRLPGFECELIDWIHFASFKAGTDNAALEWALTTARSDLASADRKHRSSAPMHRLVGLIYPRMASRPDVAQGYETDCQFLLDY